MNILRNDCFFKWKKARFGRFFFQRDPILRRQRHGGQVTCGATRRQAGAQRRRPNKKSLHSPSEKLRICYQETKENRQKRQKSFTHFWHFAW